MFLLFPQSRGVQHLRSTARNEAKTTHRWGGIKGRLILYLLDNTLTSMVLPPLSFVYMVVLHDISPKRFPADCSRATAVFCEFATRVQHFNCADFAPCRSIVHFLVGLSY